VITVEITGATALASSPVNGGAGSHCPSRAEFMVTETYWPLDDTSAAVRQSVVYE
jgi:hypothetical protein